MLDSSEVNSLPEFSLIATEENINILKSQQSKPSHFSMKSVEPEKISVFKQDVELYRVRQEYFNVRFVLNKDIDNIKLGDEIDIQIVACDNFSFVEKYISSE